MAGADALITNTILSQNFDSDTIGQLPSGWSGFPTVNDRAFVTNSVSFSAPNAFENTYTGELSGDHEALRTFPAHDLNVNDPAQRLSYAIALNVADLPNNGFDGFTFRIWNGTSLLDVGTARILQLSGQWRFFNPNNGANGGFSTSGLFNMDQWYDFRVVITPLSPSSGFAEWYMDSTLINTETYSGRSPSVTGGIDTFEIRQAAGSTAPGSFATIFVDDLRIESLIPEPSSLALLAVGGLILWRRRARNGRLA